jgi:outer membrane protein
MRFRLTVVIGWALISTTASADNLLDIYQTAQLTDAQWLAAKAANKAAQEATEQSFAAFLPNIGLSADSTYNDQDRKSSNALSPSSSERFNSNGWSLNITQPVFRMANYASHRQAKAFVRQADAQLAAAEQDLIIRVVRAYLQVLAAEAELSSVKANTKAISRQLEQAQKRYEVGLIAITDVHEAQAEYDLSKAAEIQAANEVSIAYVELGEITGQSHSDLLKLKADIPMITPKPASIDAWVDKALQDNLSIAAALAAIEVSQENVKLQRAGHYPTLDVVGTASDNTTHGRNGSDIENTSISLQLNVPIYEGGAVTSRTRQALAELEQAREEATGIHRDVESQARSSYLGVMADLSRIQALQQSIVSTQSALDATEAGFEVGTRTIVDVLDAQRALYRAKADFHIARYTYIGNYLLLKQAAGSLSDEDVNTVHSVLTEKDFVEPVSQ